MCRATAVAGNHPKKAAYGFTLGSPWEQDNLRFDPFIADNFSFIEKEVGSRLLAFENVGVKELQ